jgi:molybdenum cofactor guanylyltransferase
VLVGRGAAYADLGLEMLDDDPPGIGPLGGLVALLGRAGTGCALAVACDMPFVTGKLVARLLGAPPAPVVAPRREGRWEPLFARYDAPFTLPLARAQVAAGRHALRELLDVCGAVELRLEAGEGEELEDWDRPEDVTAS